MISRKLELRSFFNNTKLGVITSFSSKVAGAGLNFLFSIILARFLGVSDIGVYFLALTVVGIGATLARLGLDNAILRFASTAYDQDKPLELAALYRQSIGLVVTAGTMIALLIWLVTPQLSLNSDRLVKMQVLLPLILCAIIPVALIRLQGEFFKATALPGTGTFIQVVVLPIILVMGSLMFWWQGGVTVYNVLLLYASAAIVSVLFAAVAWIWRMPALWRMWGEFDIRLLMRTSFPLILVSSLNLIVGWTGILVLGAWADSSDVGLYGIAMRVTGLTAFVLEAVNAVIVPKFSTLHAKGSHQDMERIAQKSARWMLITVLPLVFVLLLFPEVVLGIFGSDFVEGAMLVRILIVGQFVNVAIGSVGFLLIMTGHEKKYRNAVAVSAILNIIGTISLVPFIGAVGAAVSSAGALILVKMISFVYVYKKLNINTMGYLFRKI